LIGPAPLKSSDGRIYSVKKVPSSEADSLWDGDSGFQRGDGAFQSNASVKLKELLRGLTEEKLIFLFSLCYEAASPAHFIQSVSSEESLQAAGRYVDRIDT
jgi:hypothetical protein